MNIRVLIIFGFLVMAGLNSAVVEAFSFRNCVNAPDFTKPDHADSEECSSNVLVVKEQSRPINGKSYITYQVSGKDGKKMIFNFPDAGLNNALVTFNDESELQGLCHSLVGNSFGYILNTVSYDTITMTQDSKPFFIMTTTGESLVRKKYVNTRVVKGLQCKPETDLEVKQRLLDRKIYLKKKIADAKAKVEESKRKIEELNAEKTRVAAYSASRKKDQTRYDEEVEQLENGKKLFMDIPPEYKRILFVVDISIVSLLYSKCNGGSCHEFVLEGLKKQLAELADDVYLNIDFTSYTNSGFLFKSPVPAKTALAKLSQITVQDLVDMAPQLEMYNPQAIFKDTLPKHVARFSENPWNKETGTFVYYGQSFNRDLYEATFNENYDRVFCFSDFHVLGVDDTDVDRGHPVINFNYLVEKLPKAPWKLTLRSFGKKYGRLDEFVEDVDAEYLGHVGTFESTADPVLAAKYQRTWAEIEADIKRYSDIMVIAQNAVDTASSDLERVNSELLDLE